VTIALCCAVALASACRYAKADDPSSGLSQQQTLLDSDRKTAVVMNIPPIANPEVRKRLWKALGEASSSVSLEIPAGKTWVDAIRIKCGSAPPDLVQFLIDLNPGGDSNPTTEARTLKFIPCPYWYFGANGVPPAVRVKSGEKLANILPLFMGVNGLNTVADVAKMNMDIVSKQGEIKQDGVINLPYISRHLHMTVPDSMEPAKVTATVLNVLPSDAKKIAQTSASLSTSEYRFVDLDILSGDFNEKCLGPSSDNDWPSDSIAIETALSSIRGGLKSPPDPALILIADTGVDITSGETSKLDLWINKSVVNGVRSRTGLLRDLHGASMVTRSGDDIGPTPGYEYASHGTDVLRVMSEFKRRAQKLSGATNFAIAKLNSDKEPYTIGLESIPNAFSYAREIDADVLSLSVVIGEAVPALIDGLRSAEFLVVVAAGNSGQWLEQQRIFPPALNEYREHMIVVGAQNWGGRMAWFSNRGPLVDIVAPGCAIPISDGKGAIKLVSGTSFAAPLVSYTVGLMKYAGMTVPTSELKARVLATGDFDSSLLGVTRYGVRLNIERAIKVNFDSISFREGDQSQTIYGKLDAPQTWTCDVHGESHAFNASQVFKIIPNYPSGGKSAPRIWERPQSGEFIEVQCDDQFDQQTLSFIPQGQENANQIKWSAISDMATRSMNNIAEP